MLPDTPFQDVRYGLRALLREPLVTCTCAGILALGVGLSGAVYVIANQLLLPGLPVVRPAELRFLYGVIPSRPTYDGSIAATGIEALRKHGGEVFQGVTGYRGDSARLVVGQMAVPLRGEAVAPGYFDVLGVRPLLGRALVSADNAPEAPAVIVLAESLWRTQFGSDPDIVGRTIRLLPRSPMQGYFDARNRQYSVVGIAPSSFRGAVRPWVSTEYWVPFEKRLIPPLRPQDPWNGFVVARLRSDATTEQVRSFMPAATALVRQRTNRGPDSDWNLTFSEYRRISLPFGERSLPQPRVIALSISVIAAAIIFIAFSNTVGIVLSRLVRRQRELAVRRALGASGARILGMFLSETLIFMIFVAVLALVFQRLILRGFVATLPRLSDAQGASPEALTTSFNLQTHPSLMVMALAGALGLIVAIVQWWYVRRHGAAERVLAEVPTGGTTAGTSIGRWILGSQIAVSTALLLTAGPILWQVIKDQRMSLGYDPRAVVLIDFEAPWWGKDDKEALARRRELMSQLLDVYRGMPIVASAALTETLPHEPIGTWIRVHDFGPSGRAFHYASKVAATPGLLSTLSIPLLAGRDFTEADRGQEARAVIMSAAFAAQLWPGGSPLGKRVAFQLPDDEHRPITWLEVVGIVGDVVAASPGAGPTPIIYTPSPEYFASLIVRLQAERAQSEQDLRALVQQMDRGVVVSRAVPVSTMLARERYPRRLAGTVLGIAGQAGVTLALIGLYGALTYSVSKRTREIGTRVALGAKRADIVSLILRDGLVTSVCGLIAGIMGAIVLSASASNQLGVPAAAGVSTAVALALVVLALAGVACYVPAARGARVDPTIALRHE